MKRLLILGGTGDAIELAAQVMGFPNLEIITSLAGRTRNPAVPSGDVRVGRFGGATGLSDYLREQEIDLLIDATHPFAAQISWNAAAAAIDAGIPHLILLRPSWEKVAGDQWIEVESMEVAAKVIPGLAQRVFLTIGRQQLAPFVPLVETWFLIRSIDPPDIFISNGQILLDRGPFSLEQERQLLREYQIEAIVSKNSGGDATYAKIIAARELEIPVVMVQRPAVPLGERAIDVASAVSWVTKRL